MKNLLKIWKIVYKFSNSWIGTIIIVLLVIFFIAQAFVIPSGSMKKTLLVGDYLFVKKYKYGIPGPTIPWVEIPITPAKYGKLINGNDPIRGDVVVFRYPNDLKRYYVKRLVATAGDRIFFQNKDLYLRPNGGDKYINNNYNNKNIVKIDGELWVKNPYKKRYIHIHNDPYIKIVDDIIIFKDTDNKVIQVPYDLTPLKNIFNHTRYKDEPIPNGEFFMVGDNRDHSSDSRYWGTVPSKYIVGAPWFVYFSINSKNFKIRWKRMFKSIDTLQGE